MSLKLIEDLHIFVEMDGNLDNSEHDIQPGTVTATISNKTVPFPYFHNTMALCYLHTAISCYFNIISYFRTASDVPADVKYILALIDSKDSLKRAQLQWKLPHLIRYDPSLTPDAYAYDAIKSHGMLLYDDDGNHFINKKYAKDLKKEIIVGFGNDMFTNETIVSALSTIAFTPEENDKSRQNKILKFNSKTTKGKQRVVFVLHRNGIAYLLIDTDVMNNGLSACLNSPWEVIENILREEDGSNPYFSTVTEMRGCDSEDYTYESHTVPWGTHESGKTFNESIKEYYTIKYCTEHEPRHQLGYRVKTPAQLDSVILITFLQLHDGIDEIKANLEAGNVYKTQEEITEAQEKIPEPITIESREFEIGSRHFTIVSSMILTPGHYIGFVPINDKEWIWMDDIAPAARAKERTYTEQEFLDISSNANLLVCIETEKLSEMLYYTELP